MSLLKHLKHHSKQSILYFETSSTILTPGRPLLGVAHLVLSQPMQAKKGVVWFEGRVQVGHESPAMVCFKSQRLFGNKPFLPAGHHRFPFRLDVPAKVPATIRIPQALVRYHLQATVFAKALLATDIHTTKEMIMLPPPTVPHTLCGKTVAGVLYSASAFCDTHRRIRLLLHLSAGSTIRYFRCGLRQSIHSRPSGEHGCTNDENYPLGWMSPPSLDNHTITDCIIFSLPADLPQNTKCHLFEIRYHVVIRMTVDNDDTHIVLELPVVIPLHGYPGSPPPEYIREEPPPTYLHTINQLPVVPDYTPSCCH